MVIDINNTVLCYGMYKDKFQYGHKEYDVRFLYDKEPAINDSLEPLWCLEKHRVIPTYASSVVSIRTIRSPKCNQVTTNDKYICTECEKVPQIDAFRLQVIPRLGFGNV